MVERVAGAESSSDEYVNALDSGSGGDEDEDDGGLQVLLPLKFMLDPRCRKDRRSLHQADNVFADLELERMRVALDVDAGLDDDLPGEEADTEGPAEPSVALLCVLHFLRMAVYLPLILFRSIAAFELIRGTKGVIYMLMSYDRDTSGRLVHIRLLFQLPLDILCTYQTSWNPTNSSLTATNKVDALVRQRAKLWAEMEKWLSHIPLRNGTLVVGDMNTPLLPEPPICGPGVASERGPAQRDQEDFQALLRRTGCQALNTWRSPGIGSRTFLPPTAGPNQHGTQIDFILARGGLADHEARQARTITAPFVPSTGCRHLPLQTTLPLPRRPRPPANRPARLIPARVQDLLRDKTIPGNLWREVETELLPSAACANPDVDAIFVAGWQKHTGGDQARQIVRPAPDGTLQLIRQLWSLREQIQGAARPNEPEKTAPSLAALWTGWRRVASLQQVQRELRKQGRLKKIRMVEQAALSDNVFRAARKFGPKTPKQRLQLRDKDGRAQTVEEEFRDIVEYFTELYGGDETAEQEFLQAPLDITWEEVDWAVSKLSPGKALGTGCISLPREWCLSELVLLPKPGKKLTSPSQLRPISLLPPIAKVTATVLAMRLKPVAMGYLRRIPQFAYVEGRSLQQAVERTIAHCAVVRALLAQQSNSLFAKRQGRVLRGIVGGIQLSLDITKAYDCVERGDLKLALQEAGNPSDLASAILAIHHQAQLRVRHGDEQADLPLRKGLRQGCSLSPLLWAVFSGWVMGRLEAADSAAHSGLATAFADDLHYSWVIKSGADLEAAYNRIMAILTHLKAHKLQVSVDKTVLIVELRGPKAQDILRKYVVEKAQGPHMRFRIHGEHIDVKIVQQHVPVCLRVYFMGSTARAYQLLKSNRTEAKALEESTQELRMIESLIQPGSLGFGQRPWYDTAVPMEIMSSRPVGPETEPELWKEEEEGLRPSKWRRPDAKGQGDTGKGHSQQQDWTYAKSWSSNEWGNDWTNAQDKSFMIFVRTDVEGNLGAILYEAGQRWNELKTTSPEKLTAPMRVILIQKLLSVVVDRFNKIMASEDKILQAQQLGWVTEQGMLAAMKWDPERRKHVPNDLFAPLDPAEVKQHLQDMIVLSASPRAVNRFHATRQMAEQYSSPTMSFMMDVGLRTKEAGEMWHLLNKLSHSSVWVMSGAYLRHARLMRDTMAQRVAQAQGGRKGAGKGKGQKGNQGSHETQLCDYASRLALRLDQLMLQLLHLTQASLCFSGVFGMRG
ncbi:unnamed protein product [Symbiodinium sp. KB8]|nr:unnamed protein product [Symbiodinium sp. KB8]